MGKTIVIALGGNAILQGGQEGTYENQLNNIRKSSKFLAKLIKDGHRIMITHGNGPQVGNILRQNEEAADVVPSMPLHVLNSQSQGFIGYMLVDCLEKELMALGVDVPVVNLLTRVKVSIEDEDFKDPSKPIGMFYTEREAEELALEKGWDMREEFGRGWRRIVPSPKPLQILEAKTIQSLAEAGNVVIACGGGGIPVTTTADGMVEGVEAVIDKDRSSCQLAKEVNADIFMILTDVENVFVNYGTPEQMALQEISVDQLEHHVTQGQFTKGSMGPKVESALGYARQNGTAIICSLEKADAALLGECGTIITKQRSRQILEYK